MLNNNFLKTKFKFFLFLFFLFYSHISFSSELEILSDEVGNGLEIKEHYKVKVNYKGSLENGNVFDSSYKRNQPFFFQIGLRQVIQGWDEGLLGMKVGGKRTLKIPPNLAYGSNGVGDIIPPNATLIFDIEILDAEPPGYKNVFPYQLKDKQKEGFKIIDIRISDERKKTGIIKNSIEITAFDIQGNFDPNFFNQYDKNIKENDHVIFVSSEGDISAILANGFVEKLGKKNIYSLVGGIKKWNEEGRRLIK